MQPFRAVGTNSPNKPSLHTFAHPVSRSYEDLERDSTAVPCRGYQPLQTFHPLAHYSTTHKVTPSSKMRAKRSKRYRKTMTQYTLPPFSFREPYQVLLDAAFLRACHAFHMPLQKFLENTLHGKCRLFVTRCSLNKIMAGWEREQTKAGVKEPAKGRPEFLPPPTEVPLRYCKHNDEETAISEVDCLIDLVAGQPKGNEQPKNKRHFVLATADPTEAERRTLGRQFANISSIPFPHN